MENVEIVFWLKACLPMPSTTETDFVISKKDSYLSSDQIQPGDGRQVPPAIPSIDKNVKEYFHCTFPGLWKGS